IRASTRQMRSLIAGIWNSGVAGVGHSVGSAVRAFHRRGWIHFPFVSQALAQVPFSFGFKLRRAVYQSLLPRIGADAILHHGVIIEDERSTIGDDVWISAGCYLDYVQVDDHVLVGPGAVLLSGGHHHRFDRLDVAIKEQGNNEKRPLRIGRGAWIGANSTVMADVGEDVIV